MNFNFSILMFFFLFSQLAEGQNSGFYYQDDFRQYLISKTKDSDNYIEKVKEAIRYPAIGRENKIEGILNFLEATSKKYDATMIKLATINTI